MATILAFIVAGIFIFILIENRKLKRTKNQKKDKKVSFYYLNFTNHDEELTEEEEFLEDLSRYKTITLHAVDKKYIYGYCHTAKAERTYVINKIEYFSSGREYFDEMYQEYLNKKD